MRKNHCSRSRRVTGGAAALALAAGQDLLVGQDGLAGGAPVGGRQAPVGQAVLVELEEPPLSPAVVVGVAGDDLALPVEDGAHPLELLSHAGDVVVGPLVGVDALLDGGVLRRQAEGVEAHGEEDVVAAHTPVSGLHVGGGHGVPVADVQVARGVGEHREVVELGPGVVVGRAVEAVGGPALLPLPLDLRWRVPVSRRHGSSLSSSGSPSTSSRPRLRRTSSRRRTTGLASRRMNTRSEPRPATR